MGKILREKDSRGAWKAPLRVRVLPNPSDDDLKRKNAPRAEDIDDARFIFAGTTGIRAMRECLGAISSISGISHTRREARVHVQVFSVESLFPSNSRDEALAALKKASGARTSSPIGSAETREAFVDDLREMQSVPTRMHA